MHSPLIPDVAELERKLARLAVKAYKAGETILSAASTSGQLFILKEVMVQVVKES